MPRQGEVQWDEALRALALKGRFAFDTRIK